MFLLDTNVVSELRRVNLGRADPRVAAWAASVPAEAMSLSVIVIEELEIGVLRAERRNPSEGAILREWFDLQVISAFRNRIWPINLAVARRSAAIQAQRSTPVRDGLIAATALVHDLKVVTRNTADFQPTGVRLLNPWL